MICHYFIEGFPGHSRERCPAPPFKSFSYHPLLFSSQQLTLCKIIFLYISLLIYCLSSPVRMQTPQKQDSDLSFTALSSCAYDSAWHRIGRYSINICWIKHWSSGNTQIPEHHGILDQWEQRSCLPSPAYSTPSFLLCIKPDVGIYKIKSEADRYVHFEYATMVVSYTYNLPAVE